MTDEAKKTTSPSNELKPVSDDHPEPLHDLSWLIVAVDGSGDGWIMDAAPGFDACDLLPHGNSCEDNGVVVPGDLSIGLYRLTEVKIGGGEKISSPVYGDDITEIEIWSNNWLRLDGLAEAALAWHRAHQAYQADAGSDHRRLGPVVLAEDNLVAAITTDAHTVATGLQAYAAKERENQAQAAVDVVVKDVKANFHPGG